MMLVVVKELVEESMTVVMVEMGVVEIVTAVMAETVGAELGTEAEIWTEAEMGSEGTQRFSDQTVYQILMVFCG